MGFLQIGQRNIAAQSLAMLNLDPADFQQPFHLTRRKITRRLITGDAVLVQTASLGTGVIDHHIMAFHRQAMCAGQTRRPCPDNGHAFAGRRRPFERMHPLGHQRISGKALQAANLNRLALGHFAHAGLFAQGFRRTDPRAHTAHDVLRKNRLGRRIGRASGDLADEERNVDGGRTGRHAGRIMAEIAAIRRYACLMGIQRRLMVGKVAGIGIAGQTASNNTLGERAVGQG